jgi:hypothetical protein
MGQKKFESLLFEPFFPIQIAFPALHADGIS